MSNHRLVLIAALILVYPAASFLPVAAQETAPGEVQSAYTLVRAVMCENIEDYGPRNLAVVFSVGVGRISCFTAFADIKSTTHTTHKWYRHDELVTTKRLTLKPPKWGSYSSIQLREADKGPWRVEILDLDDKLIQTLRFSVAD